MISPDAEPRSLDDLWPGAAGALAGKPGASVDDASLGHVDERILAELADPRPISITRSDADVDADPATESHDSDPDARRSGHRFDASVLRAKPFWSVGESAFMVGVSLRTVWRLMADPRSGFPKARRIGRRTLLPSDEVLEFVAASTATR